jgi:hypothetical protein
MIAILCGLEAERELLTASDSVQVLCGSAQRDNLAGLVASGCKGILSFGCCGGLAPQVAFGDVYLPLVLRTSGPVYSPSLGWTGALARRIKSITVTFYSDPAESAETVASRADLFRKTGAWVVDQETKAVAEFAASRSIPWTAIRSPSDLWNEDVSADTDNTTEADGSTDLGAVAGDILKGDLGNFIQDADGFGRSLDALRKAVAVVGPGFGFAV